MKILLINKYLYPKGGDAISTLETGKLLKENGHDVNFWGMDHPNNPEYLHKELFVNNVDFYESMNVFKQLKTAFNIIYSFEAKRKLNKLISIEKPDIIHLNNFYHQISPSILHAIKKYKIPTVMILHDYKIICPSYTMFSKNKPCEKCKDGRYYQCFLNKCTHDSYYKSLVNSIEMYFHHKILNIYNLIDIFISPSKFLINKAKEMGFKREIIHLPNFIDTNSYMPSYKYDQKTICYFGRLSKEKGIHTLIEAIKNMDVILKIIGDGPIKLDLMAKVKNEGLNNIVFTGYKSGNELIKEIDDSSIVIVPSEWYENYPITILESFALAKPVIGSRIGGIPELVIDGETGFTFEPGNPIDLKDKIEHILNNKDSVYKMGRIARKFVEENFNKEKYYQELIKIYQALI